MYITRAYREYRKRRQDYGFIYLSFREWVRLWWPSICNAWITCNKEQPHG